MTEPTRELLEGAGIVGLVTGPRTRLAWPESTAGEAKGLDKTAGLALSALLNFFFAPYSTGFEAISGVEIRTLPERPAVLQLRAPTTERLELHPLVADRDLTGALSREAPRVILVNTAVCDTFVVRTSNGGLFISAGVAGLDVVALVPEAAAGLAVESFAEISAPVMEWIEDLQDLWLRQEVSGAVRQPDSWRYVTSAGMLARLVERESPDEVQDAVGRLLRGELEPATSQPRLWVRSLSAIELATVEDLALSEVHILLQALEEFSTEDHPPERLGREWIRICHRRDDLEGVRLLLHEAGRALRLTESLVTLDAAGQAAVLEVPETSIPDDERMRRVALRDPEAWWGRLPGAEASE